jgi:hypothetical protein
MLSSMNFEVLYQSPISYGGGTSIHVVLRRKEGNSHFLPRTSGSHQIWRLQPGILNWMQSLLEPWRRVL